MMTMPLAAISDERVFIYGLWLYPPYLIFTLAFWLITGGLLFWWWKQLRRDEKPVWPVIGVGLVMCCPFLVVGQLFIEYSALAQERIAPSKARALAIACTLYSADHNDTFPIALNWEDATRSYWKEPDLTTPGPQWKPPARFAYNQNLSGVTVEQLINSNNTAIVFVSTLPGPNARGTKRDVYWQVLGIRRTIVGTPSGWTRMQSDYDFPKIEWEVYSKEDIARWRKENL